MPRKTKKTIEKAPAAPEIENKEPAKQDAAQENNIFSPEGELVVDVFETDSNFVVLTAIAGVQIKDLDISVEKNMMVIKGQRQDPHSHPKKNFFYQECYWGPFSRKIVLPENIDTQAADAKMDKGVLTITMPKIDAQKTNNGNNNVEIA